MFQNPFVTKAGVETDAGVENPFFYYLSAVHTV